MQAVAYLRRKIAQLADRRVLFEYDLTVAVRENLQRVAVADNIVRFRGIDEHFQLFRRPVSRFLNNDSVFRQLVGVAYTAA